MIWKTINKDSIDEFLQFKAAFEEAEADIAPEFDPAEYAADATFFAWKAKVVYDSFLKQGFTQTEAKDFIVAMLKKVTIQSFELLLFFETLRL